MRADCERRARELGVADSCRFLGYTSSAEKEELVNACDLMCVPSRNEPFGVVVLEAWDACKPVVATEAVSIIKNFEDGLLAYVQPQSIAWCINRLLSNPEEMKRLARGRVQQDRKRIQMGLHCPKDGRGLRAGPGAELIVSFFSIFFVSIAQRIVHRFWVLTERFMNGEHKGLLAPR